MPKKAHNSVVDSTKVIICPSPEQATLEGHVYHTGYTGLDIARVVIVNNGMVSGRPTVDVVMTDSAGNNYVFMITAALLQSIGQICQNVYDGLPHPENPQTN